MSPELPPYPMRHPEKPEDGRLDFVSSVQLVHDFAAGARSALLDLRLQEAMEYTEEALMRAGDAIGTTDGGDNCWDEEFQEEALSLPHPLRRARIYISQVEGEEARLRLETVVHKTAEILDMIAEIESDSEEGRADGRGPDFSEES